MNEYHYYRRLPHMQGRGGPIFITFTTKGRRVLEPSCRDVVLDCVQFGNRDFFELLAVVVMPDHVHLVLTPRIREKGHYIPVREIMKGIKGASARKINQLRGETETVWQDESFVHALRNNSDLLAAIEYIVENPVTEKLVREPNSYRWLWIGDTTGETKDSGRF
jgi:putative transposase